MHLILEIQVVDYLVVNKKTSSICVCVKNDVDIEEVRSPSTISTHTRILCVCNCVRHILRIKILYSYISIKKCFLHTHIFFYFFLITLPTCRPFLSYFSQIIIQYNCLLFTIIHVSKHGYNQCK